MFLGIWPRVLVLAGIIDSICAVIVVSMCGRASLTSCGGGMEEGCVCAYVR